MAPRHSNLAIEKLEDARRIYLNNPDGVSDTELGEMLDVSRITAWRYRSALSTKEIEEHSGRYIYVPTNKDIELAELMLGQRTST